jgi:hypothetical protein
MDAAEDTGLGRDVSCQPVTSLAPDLSLLLFETLLNEGDGDNCRKGLMESSGTFAPWSVFLSWRGCSKRVSELMLCNEGAKCSFDFQLAMSWLVECSQRGDGAMPYEYSNEEVRPPDVRRGQHPGFF